MCAPGIRSVGDVAHYLLCYVLCLMILSRTSRPKICVITIIEEYTLPLLKWPWDRFVVCVIPRHFSLSYVVCFSRFNRLKSRIPGPSLFQQGKSYFSNPVLLLLRIITLDLCTAVNVSDNVIVSIHRTNPSHFDSGMTAMGLFNALDFRQLSTMYIPLPFACCDDIHLILHILMHYDEKSNL